MIVFQHGGNDVNMQRIYLDTMYLWPKHFQEKKISFWYVYMYLEADTWQFIEESF